ncbi:MAG: RNA polymerase sigma factor [Lachnospiraceae bacterium]|nr:RNA polymerase sigma factor [Lachnospiraceae bacterium]
MDILVKKAQRGDAEAFIALIEECKMTLRRVAFGYLSNDEDVADAIQDTILAAYEHIDTLKRGEHFKTWLVRILINNCTKVWRQRKRNVSLESEQEFGHTGNIDAERSDVEFRQMLMSLPEDSRAIFQLYYGEQFTTREIASILDMNENTIKSKLHRGKEQLREQLS